MIGAVPAIGSRYAEKATVMIARVSVAAPQTIMVLAYRFEVECPIRMWLRRTPFAVG